MRLATWNVNSLTARLPAVVEWIEANNPDVLCLQETKQDDAAFSTEKFAELGYESVHFGDGRWNGVAVLSKVGLEEPTRGFGSPEDDFGCRIVSARSGGARFISVYVPNGRSLDSEHYTQKLQWLARLQTYLGEIAGPGEELAVCGDFNVAPRDSDVWDPAEFIGMTHTSEPERAALVGVLEWGLIDVVGDRHPEGGPFSWWDYRGGAFHKGHGMRIDLVLATRSLADRCIEARVDRDARKISPAGNKPSDHTPVVVDFGDPA